MQFRAGASHWPQAVKAIALILSAASAPAMADSLVLNYSVQETSPGLFHYNFALTLANQDNSWAPGQQWDWIVFGDALNQASPLADFRNFSSPDPNALLKCCSSGQHNGPTIDYGANLAFLPGWQPASVGSSLKWSGDSNTFLGAGQLKWSTLVSNAGAVRSSFGIGNMMPPGSVPEPATWSAMMLGFGLLGATARRPRMKAVLA